MAVYGIVFTLLGKPKDVTMSEKDYELPTIRLGKYRHYKGNEYQVLGVAAHSETLAPHVVYRPLYGEGDMWVRPYEMFLEKVNIEGSLVSRFEFLDDAPSSSL